MNALRCECRNLPPDFDCPVDHERELQNAIEAIDADLTELADIQGSLTPTESNDAARAYQLMLQGDLIAGAELYLRAHHREHAARVQKRIDQTGGRT